MEYEDLLSEINEYLLCDYRDISIQSEESISVYNMMCIIQNKINYLKSKENDLINKINKRNTFIKRLIKNKEDCTSGKCVKARFHNIGCENKIFIEFSSNKKNTKNKIVVITKSLDSEIQIDEGYSEPSIKDRILIEGIKEELANFFKIFEEAYYKYHICGNGEIIYFDYKIPFYDGVFTGNIESNKYEGREVQFTFELTDDEFDILKREDNNRRTLEKIVRENEEYILSKIPIMISELGKYQKQLIDDSKKRGIVLVKK